MAVEHVYQVVVIGEVFPVGKCEGTLPMVWTPRSGLFSSIAGAERALAKAKEVCSEDLDILRIPVSYFTKDGDF